MLNPACDFDHEVQAFVESKWKDIKTLPTSAPNDSAECNSGEPNHIFTELYCPNI